MTKRGPKPKPESELRRNLVSCRLTDKELSIVDARRESMSRGAWMTVAALRHPPRPVPEINREAWTKLSRLSGNLSQTVRAINLGLKTYLPPDEITAIRDEVQRLRRELLGVKDEGQD